MADIFLEALSVIYKHSGGNKNNQTEPPMNIIGKSHRFPYAAAWGSIAFLATDLTLGFVSIVQLTGPAYVTVFNTVLSMIIIGVDYFPLFASLALESVIGYMVGTAYAWMLLIAQIYKEAECDLAAKARLVLFFRDLPNLLCLMYLSVSMPLRAILLIRNRSTRILSSTERVSILRLTKKVTSSSEAKHVKNLLKPLPPLPDPPSTCMDTFIEMLKTFFRNLIYQRKHGFKYSARMLSIMLIGLMVIYKATLELTVTVISLFELAEQGLESALDKEGWSSQPNETEETSELRKENYILYKIVIDVKICFIIAISLACAGGVLTILHMLSSYRTNLLYLYKGDNTHIPPRSMLPATSLLVGSIKYAGFQVAYIAWGFILHLVVLFLIAFVLFVIITVIRIGYYEWILEVLAASWPAVLMTIVFTVTQKLLTRYVFLQEDGETLAIDNRRVLFSFTFFMFFYNIFIGFLSCLLRIMKSVVIGTVFLSRLDNSALPRRFQMQDPGFENYCGFIHVECAHTHPVMVTFLRLLMINNVTENSKAKGLEMTNVVTHTEKENKQSIIKARARTRWCLFYTLYNNPSLRVYRKSYLDYVKAMQERLTRQYKLNESAAVGNLVQNVNKVLMYNGKGDNDEDSGEGQDMTTTQANWNALLLMNKFLIQIQKDVVRKNATVRGGNRESLGTENSDKSEKKDGQKHIKDDALDFGKYKRSDKDTEVRVKNTSSFWKRAASRTLTNKESVYPTSEV